jgi:hypothetical protein
MNLDKFMPKYIRDAMNLIKIIIFLEKGVVCYSLRPCI